MKSLNRVTLLGHLGKDAEMKYTQSGIARLTFSVATTRSWKDKQTGEWKEETDWHNIVLWRKENLAEHLRRGTKVYIEGRLQTRSYEDNNGVKHRVTEIICDDLNLCGSPSGRSAGPSGTPSPNASSTSTDEYFPPVDDDDVPF